MSAKVSRRGLFGLFGGGIAAVAVPQAAVAAPPVSAFTGIADICADVSGKGMATIYGAADIYVSDFGAVTLVKTAYA